MADHFGTQKKSSMKFDQPEEIQKLYKQLKKLEIKLDQKTQALEHFKEKSIKLERSLENTKIFLNMVIHDLRNPTN